MNKKSNITIMDRNQQISHMKIKKVPQYSAYCRNHMFLQHGVESSTVRKAPSEGVFAIEGCFAPLSFQEKGRGLRFMNANTSFDSAQDDTTGVIEAESGTVRGNPLLWRGTPSEGVQPIHSISKLKNSYFLSILTV
jgi:hypothetical protein